MIVEVAGARTVLSLPVLAEEDDPLDRTPGEALSPARYPAVALEATRPMVGGYWLVGPVSATTVSGRGGVFKREWFRAFDTLGDAYSLGEVLVPNARCRRASISTRRSPRSGLRQVLRQRIGGGCRRENPAAPERVRVPERVVRRDPPIPGLRRGGKPSPMRSARHTRRWWCFRPRTGSGRRSGARPSGATSISPTDPSLARPGPRAAGRRCHDAAGCPGDARPDACVARPRRRSDRSGRCSLGSARRASG